MVRVVPVREEPAACERISTEELVIEATTVPAAIPEPETAMPTATPDMEETLSTVVLECVLPVGVTVALKQCADCNNSCLAELQNAVVAIPYLPHFCRYRLAGSESG